MVPFLDLKRQYQTLKAPMAEAVLSVLERQQFILGSEVRALEEKVAALTGATHAVGVSSGTDALLLALMALGVGEGDEVITTPFTFFATAGVIHRLGAVPVFVDIEEDTFCMDPVTARAAVTERTACIIPVHLFGLMTDMAAVRGITAGTSIHIVEDAAQAIGARQVIDGETFYAGTLGDVGCFSFFPSKNLGGAGDGGMTVTNDTATFDMLKKLRVHGSHPKYYHHLVGINGRLDEIQAAVLNVKIAHLNAWAQKRGEHAKRYREFFDTYKLDRYGIVFPEVPEGFYHAYNQFTGRFPRRDALLEYLRENGVGAAIYYPLPLHLQPCFAYLGYRKGDLPVSEKASEEVLSLPVFPELTEEEQETVIRAIGAFYEKKA